MKTNTLSHRPVPAPITHQAVGDYAYAPYIKSGSVAGHDLDNRIQAVSRLKAGVSLADAHRYEPDVRTGTVAAATPESES